MCVCVFVKLQLCIVYTSIVCDMWLGMHTYGGRDVESCVSAAVEAAGD